MSMMIQPLADRVVVKQVEAADVTMGGIIIPSMAKEHPQIAKVIEVGPGGVVDGEKVQMEVHKGDRVICSKYAGTEVKLDGTDYMIVRVGDILAIVRERPE